MYQFFSCFPLRPLSGAPLFEREGDLTSVLVLAAAGPGGPRAQRLPAAVCLREAQGPAGSDGRPALRRPHGERGHGDRPAAAGLPAGILRPRRARRRRFFHLKIVFCP